MRGLGDRACGPNLHSKAPALSKLDRTYPPKRVKKTTKTRIPRPNIRGTSDRALTLSHPEYQIDLECPIYLTAKRCDRLGLL